MRSTLALTCRAPPTRVHDHLRAVGVVQERRGRRGLTASPVRLAAPITAAPPPAPRYTGGAMKRRDPLIAPDRRLPQDRRRISA